MNNEKQKNPPAFPIQTDMVLNYGMTLRDYFAAKAMQAMKPQEWQCSYELSKKAYKIADAMLKQREL